jgi:UDP-4-amino-4,6-dideoxy-N-acetyl-beta-L-altrosamine N-acetyltransferase|nr:UDP-4-amino-4,6-dideoxy-N-acetyl-beta-L-altrosamine N-acetyltransferase [Pseudomonas chengduensis]
MFNSGAADFGSIRSMKVEDIELILAWRNHPDVRRFMFSQSEISIDEHRAWYDKSSADPRRNLLIYEEKDIPLGFVNVREVSGGGIADWSFHVSPSAPRGTGTRLGLSVLDYSFNVLRLHKVCGQILEYNERSIKLHRRLGFAQEGFLQDQFYDGRGYYSVYCFGLISSDWLVRGISVHAKSR